MNWDLKIKVVQEAAGAGKSIPVCRDCVKAGDGEGIGMLYFRISRWLVYKEKYEAESKRNNQSVLIHYHTKEFEFYR